MRVGIRIRPAARGRAAARPAARGTPRKRRAVRPGRGPPRPRHVGQQRGQIVRADRSTPAVRGRPGSTTGTGLLGEVPDDGAQLGGHVEAQAVVDAPQLPAGGEQHVAALAVGVVGEDVECAERSEFVFPPPCREQREVVLLVVGLDEELHRPGTERCVVAHDGGRHQSPAERLRQPVGGDLATVEPVGEVPERPLAPMRLVDRLHRTVRCRVPAGALEAEARNVRLELQGNRPSIVSSRVPSRSVASSNEGPDPGRQPFTRPADGGRWSGDIRVRKGRGGSRTVGRVGVRTRPGGWPGR